MTDRTAFSDPTQEIHKVITELKQKLATHEEDIINKVLAILVEKLKTEKALLWGEQEKPNFKTDKDKDDWFRYVKSVRSLLTAVLCIAGGLNIAEKFKIDQFVIGKFNEVTQKWSVLKENVGRDKVEENVNKEITGGDKVEGDIKQETVARDKVRGDVTEGDRAKQLANGQNSHKCYVETVNINNGVGNAQIGIVMGFVIALVVYLLGRGDK